MSNKITLVAGGRTVQGRLRPWGDVGLNGAVWERYWRGRRFNGHVDARAEGITWLRGWNHDKKTRDALVTSAALER